MAGQDREAHRIKRGRRLRVFVIGFIFGTVLQSRKNIYRNPVRRPTGAGAFLRRHGSRGLAVALALDPGLDLFLRPKASVGAYLDAGREAALRDPSLQGRATGYNAPLNEFGKS